MIDIPKRLLSVAEQGRYNSIVSALKAELDTFKGKLIRFFFSPALPKTKDGAVNLHLGCGPINHPSFINIDKIPAPHVHYVLSIENLLPFEDNSVDLIYACHCLEHFPHRRLTKVLREWFRVLRHDGILRLSVPDFDLLLNIYKESGNDINCIQKALLGGQEHKFNYHYSTFTARSLTVLLSKTGFRKIEHWEPGSSHLTTFDDWSDKKFTINGKAMPVSLNIEVVK